MMISPFTRISVSLLSAVALLLTVSPVFAEQYPEEVRKAFMDECVKGGTQEMCTCVLEKMEANITLAQLAAEEFTEEQILTWTEECMGLPAGTLTKSGEATAEPKTDPVEAAPASNLEWGPECKKYFAGVKELCSGDVPDTYRTACDAWVDSVNTMQGLPAGTGADMLQMYEESCKAGNDALVQVKQAMEMQ